MQCYRPISPRFRDADKIITLMSREYGKIKAVARCKRPRNRLIGGTQLFTYSEFLLFKGRQLDNISQCQIKECFRSEMI